VVGVFSTAMDIIIPIFWATCAVSGWRLLEYIREGHPTTWSRLGRLNLQDAYKNPDKWNIYWANAIFVYWSRDYIELRDARLAKQIWLVRAEVVCWCGLLTVDMILKTHGGR
jgi:hypothetical protein